MDEHTSIAIPKLVRVKPGAMSRAGIYLRREQLMKPVVFVSHGLPAEILGLLQQALETEELQVTAYHDVAQGSFEHAMELFLNLPSSADCVLGVGGGKALDVAKYAAFLAGLPFFAFPTSLSNDGFASPQSSLTVKSKRRSLASRLPLGVVVDIDICAQAPRILWQSGVGDLVAKFTAVADWKLAFHHDGTKIHDFAALLSDATVMQFLAHPDRDLIGLRTFAMALMLNGVAMELAGTSRPASGSEHLISHAFDQVSSRPRLHGLQVGLATYCVSRLQGNPHTDRILQLFQDTGFLETIRQDPFSRTEFLSAVELAPSVKHDFHTILDAVPATQLIAQYIDHDPNLRGCFQ